MQFQSGVTMGKITARCFDKFLSSLDEFRSLIPTIELKDEVQKGFLMQVLFFPFFLLNFCGYYAVSDVNLVCGTLRVVLYDRFKNLVLDGVYSIKTLQVKGECAFQFGYGVYLKLEVISRPDGYTYYIPYLEKFDEIKLLFIYSLFFLAGFCVWSYVDDDSLLPGLLNTIHPGTLPPEVWQARVFDFVFFYKVKQVV